jgi:hypothetical protein
MDRGIMTQLKILQENGNYSFRSYFELPNDPDEILAEFGYTLKQARLFVQLISKTAKRKILVGILEP